MEMHKDRTGDSAPPPPGQSAEKATDETVVIDWSEAPVHSLRDTYTTDADSLMALLLDMRLEVVNMAAYLKEYPRNSVGRDTIVMKLKGRLDSWNARLAKAQWER